MNLGSLLRAPEYFISTASWLSTTRPNSGMGRRSSELKPWERGSRYLEAGKQHRLYIEYSTRPDFKPETPRRCLIRARWYTTRWVPQARRGPCVPGSSEACCTDGAGSCLCGAEPRPATGKVRALIVLTRACQRGQTSSRPCWRSSRTQSSSCRAGRLSRCLGSIRLRHCSRLGTEKMKLEMELPMYYSGM